MVGASDLTRRPSTLIVIDSSDVVSLTRPCWVRVAGDSWFDISVLSSGSDSSGERAKHVLHALAKRSRRISFDAVVDPLPHFFAFDQASLAQQPQVV